MKKVEENKTNDRSENNDGDIIMCLKSDYFSNSFYVALIPFQLNANELELIQFPFLWLPNALSNVTD